MGKTHCPRAWLIMHWRTTKGGTYFGILGVEGNDVKRIGRSPKNQTKNSWMQWSKPRSMEWHPVKYPHSDFEQAPFLLCCLFISASPFHGRRMAFYHQCSGSTREERKLWKKRPTLVRQFLILTLSCAEWPHRRSRHMESFSMPQGFSFRRSRTPERGTTITWAYEVLMLPNTTPSH